MQQTFVPKKANPSKGLSQAKTWDREIGLPGKVIRVVSKPGSWSFVADRFLCRKACGRRYDKDFQHASTCLSIVIEVDSQQATTRARSPQDPWKTPRLCWWMTAMLE